ncbi:NUDIX hydrolase domain-like protein [Xylaria palmicola]|nr:NUDIX hydrolase domain-like protein [Xylaria palmicola]
MISKAANTADIPTDGFTTDPSLAKFQVSPVAFIKTSPPLQGICVGAFVFDDAGRLLIVQRAPHDSFPLRWEVPGGAVDDEDESVLHGLARELGEETGLQASHVRSLVGKGHVFLTRRPLCVCKYSFVVDVVAHDVRIDPEEHVAFLWVSEDEARARKVGDLDLVYTHKDQEQAILESFDTQRGEAGRHATA